MSTLFSGGLRPVVR